MIFKILLSRSVQTPNSDKNWQTSCPLQTFVCKSTFGVHHRTGSPGQRVSGSLDSQVTGSLRHKMWPSSMSDYDKKLCYRRQTARRAVSVKILSERQTNRQRTNECFSLSTMDGRGQRICSQHVNWTELSYNKSIQIHGAFIGHTLTVSWLDWLQRNYDGRCSVSSCVVIFCEHFHWNMRVLTTGVLNSVVFSLSCIDNRPIWHANSTPRVCAKFRTDWSMDRYWSWHLAGKNKQQVRSSVSNLALSWAFTVPCRVSVYVRWSQPRAILKWLNRRRCQPKIFLQSSFRIYVSYAGITQQCTNLSPGWSTARWKSTAVKNPWEFFPMGIKVIPIPI